MNIETAGEVVDQIPVKISHKIIELFSAGLYSSPNKAFEELVCNSYDAYADNVAVYIPYDLSSNNAEIWVCDNGESMGFDELKSLWLIGESTKRADADKEADRPQIGRFGIGKLATYVLANRLTYLCKKNGEYYAVTMDYASINQGGEEVSLDERRIEEREAEAILIPHIIKSGQKMLPFKLFGSKSSESWTFSIMTNLKAKSTEIKEGRLKWILSTALPLSPRFKLHFNGALLESSKIKKPIKKTWVLGDNDSTAESTKDETISQRVIEGVPCLDFEYLKGVHGKIDLYEESLIDGKASVMGRSHGIFLMVRGRLINLDDPLLGMEPFSHGPFNKCRIVVHADGLDDNLTSTRESIKDSKPLSQLKGYIKRKFNNEVRKFYFDQERLNDRKRSIDYRMSNTSLTASKRPLLVFAKKYFSGEISRPILISKPDEDVRDELLEKLQVDLESDENIIKSAEFVANNSADPIAQLDLMSGVIYINILHPFVANFQDSISSPLPIEFIAITEVLTEAHMYELSLDEADIHSVISRRDRTFRELAFSDRMGAPYVASLVKDALADADGLEDAIQHALLSLGFESTRIGGNGKPDGIASAKLGYTSVGDQSYKLTYDAKSTGKGKIQANTTHLSTINKHKNDFNADYALVVAIGFDGEDDPESTISVTSRQQKVTVMRAADLMRLLLLSAPKQIGLDQLRDLFDNCYSPLEVKKWVEDIEQRDVEIGPIKELLEVIYELQAYDTEPPELAVIRTKLNEKLKQTSNEGSEDINVPKKKVEAMLTSLKQFVPGYIDIDGQNVGLKGAPQQIMKVLSANMSQVPTDFQQMYLDIIK